jgi:hypothetical protein
MLWEWIGLGLVYFLARQLIVTRLETRAVVAVMIALAVVLAAYGFYQVGVELPAERAAYEKDPDGVLRALGQWYPPGSPERARFEDRLNSSEPLATFALANSLAGVLAPWAIVGLGVAWSFAARQGTGFARSPATVARVLGLLLCLGVVLACLVLTKSRSAYVAVAAGLVALVFVGSAGATWNWRPLVAVAVLVVLAVGVALAAGGLDARVFTGASKSLDYRLEYWQATLDMVADHPILGVCPGNFQNYYTQYKLPTASEEIRDPHNFLLETWATAGTLAFGALVVVLAGLVWQTWEAREPTLAASPPDAAPRDSLRLLLGGAAVGAPFAFWIGTPFGFSMSLEQLLGGLAIGSLVVAILWPWIQGGSLPPRLPAVGLLVLSIHLLAAGGFTFPGVAGTFWLLAALTIDSVDKLQPAGAPAKPGRRALPLVALIASIVVAGCCYFAALLPVLKSRELMARASEPRWNDEQRIALLTEAAGADPFTSEPWAAMAEISLANYKKDPKSSLWGQRLVGATGSILALERHSSAAWREVADWFEHQYAIAPNPALAEHIVHLYRNAAQLYPNSADVQARYALALNRAGNLAAARRAASRALELDGLTPHADKRLPGAMKAQIEQLLATAEDVSPTTAVPDKVK